VGETQKASGAAHPQNAVAYEQMLKTSAKRQGCDQQLLGLE
jgi:hypothetical protein